MYHLELRQFPHNFCRFNLSEPELRAAVLDAWARRESIDLGERRWTPDQATLTILAGPRLSLQELSMGRGWRNAERRSEDVTELMLAAADARAGAGVGRSRGAEGHPREAVPEGRSRGGGPGGGHSFDSSHARARVERPVMAKKAGQDDDAAGDMAAAAAELVGLLGDDPLALMRAWQLALERHPDRTPSECLALAEELLRR